MKALIVLALSISLSELVHGCAYTGRSRSGSSNTLVKRQLNLEPADCDYSYPYRTYDGSCNNLNDGTLARAGSVYKRVLEPRYEDGKDVPTLTSYTNGDPLTNGRKISRIIHGTDEILHDVLNNMFFQWGQFVAHDVAYTPWETIDEGCCQNIQSLVVDGELHPDVMVGGSCFPIIIDDDDYWWQTDEERCMEFFRSAHIIDEQGVRQQYNIASGFVDGSQVYGLNEEIALGLRSFVGGKLKATWIDNQEFLPELVGADDTHCFKIKPDDYCFAAGDDRANLFPGLAALQTVFLRYHNQIADRLASVHPDYDDEILYQEARRIVIAALQRITYNDWVLVVIGIDAALGWDLITRRMTEPYLYNSTIDPSILNVFATSAFRFGHTFVPRNMTINGEVVDLGQMFMRPHFVTDGILHLILALLDYPKENWDRWYSPGMVDNLFEEPDKPKSGYDIVARNIQRGRDHGLGTLNEYNRFFGTEIYTDFNQFEDGADELYPQVYDHVDDIDSYSGGLVNANYNDTLMKDIIGYQFNKLRWGDRFWYENADQDRSAGAKLFTEEQIAEINDNISLSKILCQTIDGLEEVATSIFTTITEENSNTLVPCDSLPDIDIEGLF